MTVRIIPRLDIKGPNLVKGIHLEGLRVLGTPGLFAREYYAEGADELLFMDAVASLYGRNSLLELFEFEETLPAESDRPVNRIGITHIAVATDAPDADYQKLEAAGVEFNAPLFGAAPSRFAYGRDPFGNVIELLEHAPAGDSSRRFD